MNSFLTKTIFLHCGNLNIFNCKLSFLNVSPIKSLSCITTLNNPFVDDAGCCIIATTLQVLCVTMENENSGQTVSVDGTAGGTAMETQAEVRDNDR